MFIWISGAWVPVLIDDDPCRCITPPPPPLECACACTNPRAATSGAYEGEVVYGNCAEGAGEPPLEP